MEVAKVSAASQYKSTKKGAVTGGVVGLGASAALYGLSSCNYLGMKGASVAAKKSRITELTKIFSDRGIDMTKTTVSKAVKAGRKAIASPASVLSAVAIGAAVFAGIGLAMDTIRNRNSKKA